MTLLQCMTVTFKIGLANWVHKTIITKMQCIINGAHVHITTRSTLNRCFMIYSQVTVITTSFNSNFRFALLAASLYHHFYIILMVFHCSHRAMLWLENSYDLQNRCVADSLNLGVCVLLLPCCCFYYFITLFCVHGFFSVFFSVFNMHWHCSYNFHFPFLLAAATTTATTTTSNLGYGQKEIAFAAKRFSFARFDFGLAFF